MNLHLVERDPAVIAAFRQSLESTGEFSLECFAHLDELHTSQNHSSEPTVVFLGSPVDWNNTGQARASVQEVKSPVVALVKDEQSGPDSSWVENGVTDVLLLTDLETPGRTLRALSYATARAKVERRLQNQNEVLKEILDDAGEGIVFANAQAQFTLFNKTAERVLGVGETIDGPERWAEIYGCFREDETTAMTMEELPLVQVLGGATVTRDHLFVKNAKLATGNHILCTGRPFATGGGALLIRDITSSVEADRAAKRHASKLESANMELSQFSYRTSHDLKAPLITVRGLSEALLQEMGEGNHEAAAELAEMIGSQASRLQTLVTDILSLAQAELAPAEDRALDFAEIVEEVSARLKSIYSNHAVELRCEVDSSVQVWAPQVRVTQIVENLVSNSIKYADERKPERYVKIALSREGSTAVLVVEDNGLGISKEFQPRMFEMFQRFHPDVSSGSGLGMYIVKKHLEKIEASIRYDSSNEGTRFEIRFREREQDT